MAKKRKLSIVYSTDPNYKFQYDNENEESTLLPGEQKLYVSNDRKQRKGKVVTLIEGFVGSKDDLNELSKKLKSACGVGGSVKENSILIQGEKKDKVAAILEKDGFKVVKKGG